MTNQTADDAKVRLANTAKDGGAQAAFDENVIPDLGGHYEQLLEDRAEAAEKLAELLKDAEIVAAQAAFEGFDDEAKAKAKQLELAPGAYRLGRHKIMVSHQEAGSRSFDVKAATRVRLGFWGDS